MRGYRSCQAIPVIIKAGLLKTEEIDTYIFRDRLKGRWLKRRRHQRKGFL